jgi:hypothetical protein
MAVGDFNNDKIPDLAIIDPPYISVLLGNGDWTFQAPSDNESFAGAKWLALADFNNDHKLDVVAVASFGSSYDIGVLLGSGDGTVQNSITQAIQYVPATVAAADLKGDGKMDAILGYELDGIAVLMGNGDGTLQPPVNYDTTGIGNDVIIVSDLNLDGKLDLAVPSSLGTGPTVGVDIFWGNGDGTLQPAQFFSTGADSGLPALGDLNGDHLPDLVFGNADVGVISMLNTGIVGFSPTSPLAFPEQLINTVSAPQTVTLTNNGTTALSIRSMKVSGKFQISNTCGSSVAAGARCTISAIFKPTSAGRQTGLITLKDSASSKPQFIELAGIATAAKVSPASLKFASQKVGTRSAPQTVTVTNEGSTALTFSAVGTGGLDAKEFSEIGDCNQDAVQPGASCSVMVTFAPTKTGARSATLYFIAKGTVSPPLVILSGTGD